MRRSFTGLADCTRQVLEQDPASDALFLFTGKRGHSLKVLWWDKTGYWILYKRLSQGLFRLPSAAHGAKSVLVEAPELALILEGIDLPSRKARVKAAAKEGRAEALRAIATLDIDRGHE
ncbi:MAG: IS66 family insertion sequence element accessory protein TnpB [Polyangiaceae bacterium]|nr:IS66 family insertion sequence element accessory protein TnpB [Polyangiaceae bacterium]